MGLAASGHGACCSFAVTGWRATNIETEVVMRFVALSLPHNSDGCGSGPLVKVTHLLQTAINRPYWLFPLYFIRRPTSEDPAHRSQ